MAVRIQLRRDTAANWSLNNPSLRPGEVGIETDTLKFKIGPANPTNGIATPWTSITSYANVTPTSLTNSLTQYILAADQGKAGGPAELDANGDLLVPENEIILWNKDVYDYTTKITATQPTADRTITLPNATGTVALTSDLNSYAPLSGATFTGNIQVPTAVVFEGVTADSYETTLQATDPTADRTITIPDVNGTIVTTGDTGSVTNTMLAGSIANNKLANSSITINGFAIALGGEAAYSTDNIQEGGTNKYFSNELAQDAAALALANGTHTNITVTYDDANNAISLAAAPGYTNEEARDAVAGLITGSTHDGVSVSYTDDGANAGSLAFTNTDKGSSQNIFKNIVVGATTVVADSNNDTLTIVGSNGVGALANATNDVIEIYNTGVTSLTGTTNEVEVDTTTGNVIVGLPNNVTISGYLTLSNSPTQASHAATKAYVDNTTAGINFHAPVHAATTTNLSATYSNGTGGVGATLTANGGEQNTALVIDGHTLNTGERVLVKNQTTGYQNGIYTVTATGSPNPGGTNWVLTRATDADNSPAGEVAYGDFVFVQNGGQAGYGFIVNTSGTITIGTTAISYVQFNAGQVVVAGNGLTETSPGTLAIDTSITVDKTTSQTLTNKTISGSSNTLSNIGNSSLTNSKVTIGSTDVSLGATATTLAGLSSVTSTSFVGALTGNADTVTNGVYTSGSYSNPSWITGLAWSKISSTPTTISGYGITNAITNAVVTDGENTITAASASARPLIIKAAASQTADLQQWVNSSGTGLVTISPNGALRAQSFYGGSGLSNISIISSNALGVNPASASTVGFIIRGASSQSANLQEWQNSSGTVLSSVLSGGAISAPNFFAGYIAGTMISAIASGPSNSGIIVRGYASQTADLQQWQDSNGNVLARIYSNGAASFAGGAVTATGGGSFVSINKSNFGVGATDDIATINIGTSSATQKGLIIKAVASQSASLQEWQDSSGTVIAFVNPQGVGRFYGLDNLGLVSIGTSRSGIASLLIDTNITTRSGIIIKGVASQTANLQEWQNSSGTVLASINASGQFVGDGSQLTGLTTALTTGTATLTANTATTISTTALSAFTSIEYMVSLKQGSKVRTSKVVMQTDGTSVDMTEFAITETGGTMTGVVISATTSGSDAVLQATVTDASSTNVNVKFSKVKL